MANKVTNSSKAMNDNMIDSISPTARYSRAASANTTTGFSHAASARTTAKFFRKAAYICAGALAFALMFVCLTGCSALTSNGASSSANEQQSENRQYMAQVNQKIESLNDALSSFSNAVAREDVVNMRTQADNALKIVDEIASIEAPSALEDVHKEYSDGCTSLKAALSAYVDLYSEIDSATEAQPFDYSTYETRLKAIQDQYDTGIEKLKSGDEKAAGKE